MMRYFLALLLTALFAAPSVAQSDAGNAPRPGPPPPAADASKAAEVDRLSQEALKLYGQRKYEEALPPAREALRLAEEAYGPRHPRLLALLYNLGAVQTGRPKRGEAGAALKRALPVYEQTPTEGHTLAGEVLDLLGLLNFQDRQYGEAGKYWARAVEVAEKAFGPESLNLARPVYRLADFYRAVSDEKKAFPLYLRAVQLWLKEPRANKLFIDKAPDGYYCSLINSDLNPGDVERAMKDFHEMKRLVEPLPEPRGADVVNAGILHGKAISKPMPKYPQEAMRAGIAGAVAGKIVVDEEGKVAEANPMCAHPVLMRAAREAALAARFTPTKLSGVPVRVTGIITYRFELRR